MGLDMNASCAVHTGMQMLLTKHPAGYQVYSMEPGSGIVIALHADDTSRAAGANRFAADAAIELKPNLPIGREVDASIWVSRALCHYGANILLFESRVVAGTVLLRRAPGSDQLHGSVDLTFVEPQIDRRDLQQVHLSCTF